MELKLNRKYKDTLFRKVFNNKKDLLSLDNALNDTSHTDDSLITINTIELVRYVCDKLTPRLLALSLLGHVVDDDQRAALGLVG